MLKQRLIFGALGIVLALGVLIFCPIEVIGCFVALISFIGMCEFFKVTGAKKSPVVLVGYLYSIAVFGYAIFCRQNLMDVILPFSVAYIFVSMAIMVLFRSKTSFTNLALSVSGTMYITLFFMHILLIRQQSGGNLAIWLIFISAWSTDTFAYFVGKGFGKHKLCPNISPKKTVEGAIGGILGCALCISLYVFICSKYAAIQVNYLNAVLLSCLTSVFSQFGDLAASCIKREYGVKDYGNLIPGHGGILDRFDSALLISPLVYYFTLYLPVLIK